MEELYKKILSGELNIKYLSPIDLVNLEAYLEQMHINLEDMLKITKKTNADLENKKNQLKSEIIFEEGII